MTGERVVPTTHARENGAAERASRAASSLRRRQPPPLGRSGASMRMRMCRSLRVHSLKQRANACAAAAGGWAGSRHPGLGLTPAVGRARAIQGWIQTQRRGSDGLVHGRARAGVEQHHG